MTRKLVLLSALAAIGAMASPSLAKTAAKPAQTAKTAKVSKLTSEFRAYDTNKDGALSQAELQKSGMSKAVAANEMKLFKSADRNHDGKITAGEFNWSVANRLNAIERHS